VLGPRLFILYIADLADEIDQHGDNFHAYADDSQLYVHCNHVDTASSVTRLERCIANIGHWMSANRLKLNADKTELLWTGTKHSLSLLGGCGPDLRLGADTVTASEHVRLLGVTISSDLSLDKHVNNVCAAGFFRLRQLRRVRRSLDPVSATTLVHAFVSFRVDYCNAIFAGAPKTIIDRLQHVLNAAARVVSDTRKFDRGLSRLMHTELHWLDAPERYAYVPMPAQPSSSVPDGPLCASL